MRACDLMTRSVYTVRIDTSINQAMALLTQNQITAAPVLDLSGNLAGIVSETDLLGNRLLGAAGAPALWDGDAGEDAARPTSVGEVMTQAVVTASVNADIGEVAERMLESAVHSMPVVDGSRVVGMISRSDLLRSLVRDDDIITAEVQHRLDEYSGGTRRWAVTVVDGAATIQGQFDDNVEKDVVTVLARTVSGVNSTSYTADHGRSEVAPR